MKTLVLILVLCSCAVRPPSELLDASTTDTATADAPKVWDPSPQATFTDKTGVHPDVELVSPSDYAATADRARPLVVFLHMYGTGAPYPGWLPIASADVLSLRPLGAIDARGNHYWNGSAACCDEYFVGNDDVAYVGGLLDSVIAAGWHVDLSQVWIVGASSGGFLAERLACDRSDVVTAIVDLAGAGRAAADPPCNPDRPVAALIDHSQGDGIISWNGGTWQGLPNYPSVTGAGGTTDRGGSSCQTVIVAGQLDHDARVTGNDTDVYDETNCTRGPTTLWRESTSQHVFTPTPAWGSDALSWLQAHPRT